MGDEGNLFNTFSFGSWNSKKKEEELERENRRRRREHVKKLKAKLRKDKERLKEGGPFAGSDLEAIMAALAANGVNPNGDGDGWNESDDEVLKEIMPLVRSNRPNDPNGYGNPNGVDGYDDDYRPSSGVEFNYNRKFMYDKFD
uniref:Uncharacterized protein n=1 Tax=Plectus sambesii TaxID=2011161 RepID=A0A914VZ67_9BILA